MEGYLQKRSVRVALLLAIALSALGAMYLLRSVFAPLLLGWLCAYVLDPLADAVEKFRLGPVRFNRMGAVVVIFAIATLAFAGVALTGGYYTASWVHGVVFKIVGEPEFKEADPANEKKKFSRDLETGVAYNDYNGNGKWDRGIVFHAKASLAKLEVESRVVREVETFIDDHGAEIMKIAQDEAPRYLRPLAWVWEKKEGKKATFSAAPEDDADESGGLFTLFSWLMFCPVYTFFFLLEFDTLVAAVRRYLPARSRDTIERLAAEIDQTISSFLRGRLIVCLVKGGLTTAGLWLLGVDYAFLLGMSAGFLSLIPYVGIYFSMVPAILLAWMGGSTLVWILMVPLLFMVIEALEGFVLVPMFLGKEVGLHPLTILVTMLIFGKIFGLLGLLLSVPLAAICKILGKEFLMPIIVEFANEKVPGDGKSAAEGSA